jgi:hypothetical protein
VKVKIILSVLAFGLIHLVANAGVGERTKFKMFCSAISNFSTAPNYVVVTVKNKKTGETKEVCTEATSIQGAVADETGKWVLNCKNYKTRYFEFSKDGPLRNISFDLYSKAELDAYAKTINVAGIVNQVKTGMLTNKTFKGERKEQIMFAHLMFNNGVMVTQGCIAGNICGLTYFLSKSR